LRLSARRDAGSGVSKAISSRKRRAGFTLVEVIVVLVILAILAAIAIPALTGYIEKAQDKQYIAEARNISVAIKTVLVEAYASGEINDEPSDLNYLKWSSMDYFTTPSVIINMARFSIESISEIATQGTDGTRTYYRRAAALIGEAYAADDNIWTERYWSYIPVTKPGSGATAATADGFFLTLRPQGSTPGKPVILITYKMPRRSIATTNANELWDIFFDDDAAYDPNAGYEVYKFVVPEPE
jgi:prepilin-type N-terminal cleavage/methylation domain-containing protein